MDGEKVGAHQQEQPENKINKDDVLNASTSDSEKKDMSFGTIEKVSTVQRTDGVDEARNRRKMLWIIGMFVVFIVVVLAVVVTTIKDAEEEAKATDPPIEMSFETGVSLITYYGINATISQRLARTVVTMQIANALDCTSIHSVTLQLPLKARVAAVRTWADDGCTTTGEVKKLEEAREIFVETATQGLPGAYVEARDSVIYNVQVSLPPMGNTIVELVLEEVLRQKVGEVQFQLPFVPNEQVDQISLDITILDVNTVDVLPPTGGDNETLSGPVFQLDLGDDFDVGKENSPFSRKIPDAREYNLPRVLQGVYTPAPIPSNGVLFRDGRCFEHTFLPSDLEPKSKNVFFVVDTSSYGYWDSDYFTQMKVALSNTIDSLSPEDTLTIQTFSHSGTESLWGSSKMSFEEKIDAKEFVKELKPGRGANLHEAILEGLLRAKRDSDTESGTVTLLVLLSNSWASVGATNRSQIASDVWKLNKEGRVKLFSLGSPGADMELLRAIAVMNGGITTSIITGGTADYVSQIESFFDSEFGNVLLSDVNVDFFGEGEVSGETPRFFPVLAQGSEVVVRGLLGKNHTLNEGTFQAVTTAVSKDGEQTWTATAIPDPFVPTLGLPNSRCFQSYAQSRITQLMHLRDVAILLGDNVVEPIVSLTQSCDRKVNSLADCIKEEALSLALEAKIVTAGLTGLVTVDNQQCLPFEEGAEICLDGISKSEFWDEYESEVAEDGHDISEGGAYYNDYSASAGTAAEFQSFLVLIAALWIMSFVFSLL